MPNGNQHHRQAKGNWNRGKNANIPEPELDTQKVKRWIQKGIDPEAIGFFEKTGKYLVDVELSNSQIRNIYGEIMRIYMKGADKEKTALLLLKPKIAYMREKAGRSNKKGLAYIEKLFNAMYDALEKEDNGKLKQQFDNMLHSMEAILAYHKAQGGKD